MPWPLGELLPIMFSGLIKAFDQIPDPVFRRVALRALGWSLLLFAVLMAVVWYALSETRLFEDGWLETVVDSLGWFGALIIAGLLFPAAALTVITFFLEDIARAVEARHYPDLPPPRDQHLSELVWTGLKFAAIAVGLNLVALPIYLLLLFVPPLNIFVFYSVNGYLLGREYFELVAFRRLDPGTSRETWRNNRGKLFFAGVIITALLSIPFVNWFMPVIAAAYMVHMFESIRQRETGA